LFQRCGIIPQANIVWPLRARFGTGPLIE